MAERITLTTIDDMKIIGDWVPAPTVVGAALLLHMSPETSSSWSSVQLALAKRGVASLAIDLRGHGRSTQNIDGQTFSYETFTDQEHRSSSLDVSAAVSWIRTRGIDLNRIVLIGASIGANLAILELTEEPRLAGAVLLSPGLEYHGVDISEELENVIYDQHLLIIAAEDDAKPFAESQQIYHDLPVANKTFTPYQRGGHGTNMFKTETKLVDTIAEWTANLIKGA